MTSGARRISALTPTAPTADVPRRLLVVSATIGEGHNATAAAVEERARALWPGCQIRRVDTLGLMGRGTGPAFRWIYRVNVDRTPWLYDFFYRELWRRPWFARASCRFTGAWAGRALAQVVADFQPDLVVSTYPLGTGGLDWLRRRGALEVPVAAMISDFAPHPFWVYPEVDLHYVASEPSLQAMWRARPDARGAVGAPPVVSAFGPADRMAARAALGLPPPGPVVLISCGSLGFGSVERAVDAALAADPDICVVVTCGRNEELRARLAARNEPARRLVPLGWTDRMPELTAAADVVVTNAGGATALEALATGRTVLLFEPIAGHGKANAALMEQAGLGRVCADARALTGTLRALVRSPELLAAAERRAVEHVRALDFDTEVAALPELPRHHGSRPLAAPDALFVGAATAEVPQQVGAVVLLSPPGGAADAEGGAADSILDPERIAASLRRRFLERSGQLPMLRRRLWLARHRRPRWLTEDAVDPSRHITARKVVAGWDDAVREFFDAPVPMDGPPWQLQVLAQTGGPGGGGGGESAGPRLAVLAKLHHALGDGLAVTATLVELLSDTPRPYLRPVPAVSPSAGTRFPPVGLARLARGLVGLATAGRAAVGTPRPSGRDRRYAMVELPAKQVRATARELRTGTSALLLGVLGEALYRHGAPVATSNGRLRTAVPLTASRVRRASTDSPAGNDTAAVILDLPVGPLVPMGSPAGATNPSGPLSTRRRIEQVAGELARLDQEGHSLAARFAVRALGRMPAALHPWLARLVYGGRFFSLIASVMPGHRREVPVLGARVSLVYPVLPLADRVGLAVGFLSWGDGLGVGITADRALFCEPDRFARTLVRVVDELTGEDSTNG